MQDVKDVKGHDSSRVSYDDESIEQEKQRGVLTAEASRALMGRKVWLMYLGIALTAYATGLDNNTMYAYVTAATEAFNSYPLYTTITCIQQVLIGVGKFPIAKLSDVFGRAQGYAISLVFYLIGFIILATCQRFSDICGGVVLYALGNTGVQIMQQIVIADAVSTKWRGASIGLLSLPYLVNFGIAGKITAAITADTWRWGPGMFAIIMPVAVSPVIFALALSQRAATKSGLAPKHPYFQMSPLKGLSSFARDLDLGGLFLIVAGFVLFLIPLNIAALAAKGWAAPHIIAMLVVGGVLIISTGFYEWLISPVPVLKRRFVFNKDVLFPTIIGFFDFLAFYLSWSSVYYYVVILKGWSSSDAVYFSDTQSICLTVFGIAVGFINRFTLHYKWSMVAGACIRMLGIGLMIAFRDASATTAQLVIPQIIQGLGGGFLGINLQVAAQASVPHQDVAMVTAFVLLFTEIGGACGTAIIGSVQNNVLPNRLLRYLPDAPESVRLSLFTAPFTATYTYPLGTPERTALIHAWNDYMHINLIIAVVVSVVPIVLALLVTNRKLGDTQNCVTDEPVMQPSRRAEEDSA